MPLWVEILLLKAFFKLRDICGHSVQAPKLISFGGSYSFVYFQQLQQQQMEAELEVGGHVSCDWRSQRSLAPFQPDKYPSWFELLT